MPKGAAFTVLNNSLFSLDLLIYSPLAISLQHLQHDLRYHYGWKALPAVARLMLFNLLSFFHFIRRFWNQILI